MRTAASEPKSNESAVSPAVIPEIIISMKTISNGDWSMKTTRVGRPGLNEAFVS